MVAATVTRPDDVDDRPPDRDKHGRFAAGNNANPQGSPLLRKPTAPPLPDAVPMTARALNRWLKKATGYTLPAQAVCPNHTAPLAAVWAVFNHDEAEVVWLGSRGSGKTLALALLHIANSSLKPGFETAHYGAILPQAKRCHRYIDDAARRPSLAQSVELLQVTRVAWANKSETTINPLTDRQAQSPHAALVSVDEVESAKPGPLERVRSVPMAYGDHPGQLILCSTRVEAAGLMDATIEDAKAKGVPVHEWCWLESLEPCTIEPDSPLYEYLPAELRAESGAGNAVTIESDGWRSLADMEAAHSRVSKETWMTEYLNLKPAAKALVYPVEPNVTERAEYKPGAGPVFVGGDWGFADDTAFVLSQLRGTELAVFDLLSGKGISERDWARKLIERITQLPDYDGPDMDEWERIWEEGDWRAADWPSCWPEVAADPSAAQLRFEWKEHGVTVFSPKRVKHKVVSGQDVLRGAMQRSIVFHPRVEALLVARQNYRTKQLPDGSYSAAPDPDDRNHRWSHSLDALRYLVWAIRRRLGLGSAPADDDEEED